MDSAGSSFLKNNIINFFLILGHNMGYSHYECMKLLAKRELNWKYIVLLQVSLILSRFLECNGVEIRG